MEVLVKNKTCQTCKMSIEVHLFYKNKRSNDGLDFSCKRCAIKAKKKSREYRSSNTVDRRYLLKNNDTKNDLRQCDKCGTIKSLKDFPRSKRCYLGRSGSCKICKVKYRDTWLPYFIKKYGEHPLCTICNKILTWEIKDKIKKAHFDHRHGGSEAIAMSPSTWYQARFCTKENIRIFESCDFGILCVRCNSNIPTKDRKEWLQKITKYING